MTVRWGIIGCGNVCEVKSGPAFQKAEGSELAAVMRRNGQLAEDFARRHGVARWYDSAEALIADSGVDAIYIATPPGRHLEYALQACRAGKPTYVEKPMARGYAECRLMVEAFAEADCPLFVAYYRRCLDRFKRVGRLIEDGQLGRITGVSYRFTSPAHRAVRREKLPWRLQADQAGGGLFLDLGSHTLDILDFLLGELTDVQGDSANIATDCDVEDNVVMTFRTAEGALGVASWDFAAHSSEDMIEIAGTAGRVRLSTFGDEQISLEADAGPRIDDLPNPPHIQQPLIQTIVDQLNGSGQCPSTGDSAARTSRVMDIVLSGYYAGREDDFWSRPQTWPGRRD